MQADAEVEAVPKSKGYPGAAEALDVRPGLGRWELLRSSPIRNRPALERAVREGETSDHVEVDSVHTLRLARDVTGLPLPNEIRLVLDDDLPPVHLVTSALGYLFQGNRVLLSNLVRRGWEIPGGHLEPGESPEEAVRREAMEEAGAVIEDLRVLGYEKISLGGPKPEGYPYPHPVSYQVFFYGRVKDLRPFNATSEVRERRLFEPSSIPKLDGVARDMYEAALAKVSSVK